MMPVSSHQVDCLRERIYMLLEVIRAMSPDESIEVRAMSADESTEVHVNMMIY